MIGRSEDYPHVSISSHHDSMASHIGQLPPPVQIRHQSSRMIVQKGAARARNGVCVGVVTPCKDTYFGDIDTEQITEPVNSVFGGPGFFAMAVKTVDNDDTVKRVVR